MANEISKEWQGINLTGAAQTQWVNQHIRQIKLLSIVLIISISFAVMITSLNLQNSKKNKPLATQLNQIESDIKQIEQRIKNITANKHLHLPFIDTEEISFLLNLVQGIPLKNGGLNSIQIYLEQQPLLKIAGKTSAHSQFQELEKYLKNNKNYHYKIEQVNLNNKNETDFIILIKFRS